MNAEVKDGRLSISLLSIIASLTPEDQTAIIDALSCRSEVIKNVVDQILDGWTEQGSHGSILCTTIADPCYPGLDNARRRIAKQAGEVAKAEIERLEKALEQSNQEYADLLERNRAWRNGI